MRYSPEALMAFVETVSCGSFSAAARRLRKSQSTISTAIAHLEADLGFSLFDRSSRQPVLTEEGKRVLSYVQAILSASDRLDEVALTLSGETEARLTFVLSDTLHPDSLEELMAQFDRQFPHTEFECLIGENDDVIDLLLKRRTKSAKAFQIKYENSNFRASIETVVLCMSVSFTFICLKNIHIISDIKIFS